MDSHSDRDNETCITPLVSALLFPFPLSNCWNARPGNAASVSECSSGIAPWTTKEVRRDCAAPTGWANRLLLCFLPCFLIFKNIFTCFASGTCMTDQSAKLTQGCWELWLDPMTPALAWFSLFRIAQGFLCFNSRSVSESCFSEKALQVCKITESCKLLNFYSKRDSGMISSISP